MAEEPEQALDKMAEDTRNLREGLEDEMKNDLDKAKGESTPPKRPWWKVWGRTQGSRP
jgi:hypothetical protein